MPLVSFHFLCIHSSAEFVRADPIAFPDPEKFDPQRWLDPKCHLEEGMKSLTFGFDRRYVVPTVMSRHNEVHSLVFE
jgi:hypothetical protein